MIGKDLTDLYLPWQLANHPRSLEDQVNGERDDIVDEGQSFERPQGQCEAHAIHIPVETNKQSLVYRWFAIKKVAIKHTNKQQFWEKKEDVV